MFREAVRRPIDFCLSVDFGVSGFCCPFCGGCCASRRLRRARLFSRRSCCCAALCGRKKRPRARRGGCCFCASSSRRSSLSLLPIPCSIPQPIISGGGDVLIAVDNDWAAARDWDARRDALHHFIETAEREGRNVILLPTAPPANGEAMQLIGPMAAKAAYAFADRLMPMPWPSDWSGAKALLDKFDDTPVAYNIWLNSGLGNKAAGEFLRSAQGKQQNYGNARFERY